MVYYVRHRVLARWFGRSVPTLKIKKNTMSLLTIGRGHSRQC
jgi:hypothetical protein